MRAVSTGRRALQAADAPGAAAAGRPAASRQAQWAGQLRQAAPWATLPASAAASASAAACPSCSNQFYKRVLKFGSTHLR